MCIHIHMYKTFDTVRLPLLAAEAKNTNIWTVQDCPQAAKLHRNVSMYLCDSISQ